MKDGYFYISHLDWGDGSPMEYNNDKPFQLDWNTILKHGYEKSGIYEITGYMLMINPTENIDNEPNTEIPTSVVYNQFFTIRIHINEGLDNEFEYLGGDGFDFIPYKETTPVIGGISDDSIYYENIRRQLGYINNTETTPSVEVTFKNDNYRLKYENALSILDNTKIGSLQQHYTGSYTDTDNLTI